MKYVSIDIETTGLDFEKDQILEFAAVIDDSDLFTVSIEQLPFFHCFFKSERYTGSPYALSMHSRIFKILADLEKEKDIHNYKFYYLDDECHKIHCTNFASCFGHDFYNFLIKNGFEHKCVEHRLTYNAAGKNFVAFDFPFLHKQTTFTMFAKPRYRALDPAILYLDKIDTELPSTETCKKRCYKCFDDLEVSHTALGDARDVIKLLRFKLRSVFHPEVTEQT